MTNDDRQVDIDIDIGNIHLDGVEGIEPGDAGAVRAAVVAELRRLVQTSGVAAAVAEGRRRVQAAPRVELSPGAGPADVGVTIARAVYAGALS